MQNPVFARSDRFLLGARKPDRIHIKYSSRRYRLYERARQDYCMDELSVEILITISTLDPSLLTPDTDLYGNQAQWEAQGLTNPAKRTSNAVEDGPLELL